MGGGVTEWGLEKSRGAWSGWWASTVTEHSVAAVTEHASYHTVSSWNAQCVSLGDFPWVLRQYSRSPGGRDFRRALLSMLWMERHTLSTVSAGLQRKEAKAQVS
eukprot:TRINITY_DN1814_c0_g1_i1.p6 TRINITY_DN1814_c0_g1~~TRINITY_DN1814_c0_g1_i1.p6  ORF type:complete len:104 (+),score=10.50 TRINITY_DN1814_c0_g1_i1:518-829(+)